VTKVAVRFEPWPRGKCEAGVVTFSHGDLEPCDRRGRWLGDGVILCGRCKRIVEKQEATRNAD